MKSMGVANRQSPIIQLTRLRPHESFLFLSFILSLSLSLFLLMITIGYFQPVWICMDEALKVSLL